MTSQGPQTRPGQGRGQRSGPVTPANSRGACPQVRQENDSGIAIHGVRPFSRSPSLRRAGADPREGGSWLVNEISLRGSFVPLLPRSTVTRARKTVTHSRSAVRGFATRCGGQAGVLRSLLPRGASAAFFQSQPTLAHHVHHDIEEQVRAVIVVSRHIEPHRHGTNRSERGFEDEQECFAPGARSV